MRVGVGWEDLWKLTSLVLASSKGHDISVVLRNLCRLQIDISPDSWDAFAADVVLAGLASGIAALDVV